MGDSARAPTSIITQPSGGGAVQGMGETFAPDPHTGTGNFTVPIALPPGRNGFQPQLALVYSTGNGNGYFGWGWSLDVPGITRQTSRGVPLYDPDGPFLLSGAEELVPVSGSHPGRVNFRPRTEGLFARIGHVTGPTGDHWEVTGKNGLTSRYGTPRPAAAPSGWSDPAVVAAPERRDHVFAWRITETRDPFGNQIRYRYNERDAGEEGPHSWNQPLLTDIDYADHGDSAAEAFLVHIHFGYEPRTDAFSDYRAGFEIRTTRRCQHILIETDTDAVRAVRRYDFTYCTDPANGASLLSTVVVSGFDDDGQAVQELPPLTFEHTSFEPGRRRFAPLTGQDLPTGSLAREDLELVDLFGSGLPDLLQMNGTTRYWRNLGEGRFDLPRPMRTAPAGLSLADKGVQLLDANGDGRADLLVTTPGRAGYFPLRFDGTWHPDSFHRYPQAPSFDLADASVRLIDLDGDGVTDAIRSGTRLECFFQDRAQGWHGVRTVDRRSLEHFPDVDFADPRVQWADMTGDGLQDIVLVQDGNVSYWPSLGHGRWGKRITPRNSPRFPAGYDPACILLGDVDGDGLADLVYVGHDAVRLWINHSGGAWSREPVVVRGTPPAGHTPSLRLADVFGTGVCGVLWSTDAIGGGHGNHWFLDFTGGTKPYLLESMRNNMGAVTRVGYAPSSRFLVADRADARTQWRTPLPFPVHVVARVEVIDEISGGKLTTEYRYRHGYWGGTDREFRGFGMVDQRDTETFDSYDMPGLHPDLPFTPVAKQHFAAPTMTRTWFHLGDVEDTDGEWAQPDHSNEYWQGDPQLLDHEHGIATQLAVFAQGPDSRAMKRDALRALRGNVLRTELYALDGSARESDPYTVTEYSYGVEEVVRDDETRTGRVYFPYPRAQRTTQWERGDDPMTQFTFLGDYDEFGQLRRQTRIACPRGWRTMNERTTGYLATRARTVYAKPAGPSPVHIVDRVARSSTFALGPTAPRTVTELSRLPDDSSELNLIGQTLHHYDGDAFTGLPQGVIGRYGALVRTETLVLTERILQDAYGAERPPYLVPGETPVWNGDYPQNFRDGLVRRAGYVFHAADVAYEEGYFATTERRRYDFHDPGLPPRGLVTAYRPALGTDAARDTLVAHDPYGLLPAELTDPVGLTVKARYDYRVLKVTELTDANGNTSYFTYTPLGLLATTRVTGKAGEGDQQRPSVTRTMNLRAFERHGRPVYIHTSKRVRHDEDETIDVREYSDGFGRLVQTRSQAEDILFGDAVHGDGVVPAAQGSAPGTITGRVRGEGAPPNVVVSGRQTYDNKGRVVESYEPYFALGWDHEPPMIEPQGAKATSFYDPRGTLVRTVNPDGSEQRVVHGVPLRLDTPDRYRPTPWEAYSYDTNDNAGRTHPSASPSYAHHHDTPDSILVDGLGHTVEAVRRNRLPGSPVEELHARMTYDVRGNLLTMTDPLDREVFRHVYDLADRRLRMVSRDAGTRRAVFAADGLMAEHRDDREALVLYGYDSAGRLDRSWARDDGLGTVTLREHLTFGDGGRPDQPAAERATNRAANRLGRPYRAYDEAGLILSEEYDFKGNLLDCTRHVVKDTALVPGWTPDWDSPDPDDSLDALVYRTSFGYDALDRPAFSRHPQDVTGSRAELRPTYNRAGALQSVALDGVPYIRHIAYNSKGQRTFVLHGNGVLIGFAHDPRTFRLRRLWTGRVAEPAGTSYTYVPAGAATPLQDLAYDYDLVGNPVAIHDRTPGSGVAPLPDALDRAFTYDALYRLRSATGRECDTPPPARPWDVSPRCLDVTRTRACQQTYDYDAADNLTSIRHTAGVTSHTRTFALAVGGNRLETVQTGSDSFSYAYDANGSMSRETDSRHFAWDHSDRLTGYRTQAGGGPSSVQAYYLYGADGRRVKKLVRKQNGPAESTICPDGLFEHHTVGAVQNNTLQVVDDERRVALVRVGPALPHDGAFDAPVQYHLGDHLGSSSLVLGGATAADGAFVSREEYTPYGETSFGSHGRKRYRYSGKERDEESGLAYFGFRYYAPWLGRWTSPDPAGAVDGLNLFTYVHNNPVALQDVSGLAGEDPLVAARRGATGGRYDEQFANPGRESKFARMAEGAISVNGTTVTPPPTLSAPARQATEGAESDPAVTPGSGRPSLSELRQERWEAAKSGMKNELIDMFSESFGVGTFGVLKSGLDKFKDKPPVDTGDTIRDLEVRESFEGGKVVTDAVSVGVSFVPVGEIAQSVKVLSKGIQLGPKTHITYIFKDASGIRYIGRAQGFGTPEEVLHQRLMKGHHVFLANDALEAEVLAEHGSKASAMGGESVYHDYFKETGHKLLNNENPLSFRRDRLQKTEARIKAFFDDW